jgi:hypothetical protein
MNLLKIASLVAAFGVGLASASAAARAETCGSANKPVAGTLAAPSNPCPPPPKKPTVVRRGPKEPEAKAPGTYKHGNTTIYIGGSVGTDVNVRGR